MGAACLVIPVFTKGGAIPVGAAILGAYVCVRFAGDPQIPIGHRIAMGVAMVLLCWGIVLVMLWGVKTFAK